MKRTLVLGFDANALGDDPVGAALGIAEHADAQLAFAHVVDGGGAVPILRDADGEAPRVRLGDLLVEER